jgi:hypothetical protein
MEFGPYRIWEKAKSPGNVERYNQVLSELARFVSETTGREVTAEAVRNQVDWAIGHERRIKTKGLLRNYILSSAAAIEVGFVKSSDLPDTLMLTELTDTGED